MLTALEYLREDMEETNKNSCEAKETPELEAKKNNEGTEIPDMTTTTSHMPEDYANLEVMTAWQEGQKKGNDGKLAKLKVFGEKSTQINFFQLTFHCHERQIIEAFYSIIFCFREESSARCRSFCWLGLCRCCYCFLLWLRNNSLSMYFIVMCVSQDIIFVLF